MRTKYRPGRSVPDKPLAERLRQMNVKPDDVTYVRISHFHAERRPPAGGAEERHAADRRQRQGLVEWIAESRKVEAPQSAKDVFGDGRVMVLRVPGDTPGHSTLLVRLKATSPSGRPGA